VKEWSVKFTGTKIMTVPGVGHDSAGMWNFTNGAAALFFDR